LSSPDDPQFQPQMPLGTDPQATPTAPDSLTSFDKAEVGRVISGPPSVENPPWNIWDVLLIVALALVTAVTLKLSVDLVAHRFIYPRETFTEVDQEPTPAILVQFTIDGLVAVYLILLVEGKYRTRFWNAIRWNWPRSEWRLLGLGALTLIGLSLFERFLPLPKETPFEKLFASPLDAYLLAIIAVSLGPLVEELFFRGFFYPVLARRLGAAWGVFLTALPFALLHLPQYGWSWGVILVILSVGIVCGIVRAVTRSVGASFLVHAGYNGAQMLIALAYTHGFRHLDKAVIVHS
jgi:membrane protease YdiL (CAAX protease family)